AARWRAPAVRVDPAARHVRARHGLPPRGDPAPRRGPGARRDPGVRPHDVPRPGPDAGAPVHRRRPRPRGPARFSGGSAVTHAAPPPADKVALLGPRAVGKSTLGRALAARLGW